MNDLHVFTNGVEWWVSPSLGAVYAARTDWCGETREDMEDPFWQTDDAETIGIVVNERGEIDDRGAPLTLTTSEWATREGPGFLASTEY